MSGALRFVVYFLLLWAISASHAQPGHAQPSNAQPDNEATRAEITAADGTVLVGDYYRPATQASPAPAVILLHMVNGRRTDWTPLILPLREAGFHVLAVDLRGYGDTGGRADWLANAEDVALWQAWMRAQPDVRADAVGLVGASAGGNLAIIGCANAPTCYAAAALSPVVDYGGLEPEPFVADGLAQRPLLVMAAQGDRSSVTAIRLFFAAATGPALARLYGGRSHGTNLLTNPQVSERVRGQIIGWLTEHLPVQES